MEILRYLIKDTFGGFRNVANITINEKGNYITEDGKVFNSDGKGLRKAKEKTLIPVTKDNWDTLKSEWIDHEVKDYQNKLKFQETPSPLRTFRVGEKVKVGNLKNVIVEKIFNEGKIIAISFDSKVKDKFGKSVGYAPAIACWLPYNIKKVNIKTREQNFTQENKLEFNYRKMTISSLLHYVFEWGIDMDPDYQRGYVWDDSDKEKLLDSIFKGIEIGKIALIKNEFNDSYSYEMFDGKQRLSTLVDFVMDKYKYKGFYFSELSSKDNFHILNNYFISVALIENSITEKQKLEYFIRLNTSGKVMGADYLNKLLKKYNKMN